MINQDLVFYIKEQQRNGIPASVIKELLITRGGWKETDIDEAFKFITVGGTKEAVAPTPPPTPAPVVAPTPALKLETNIVSPAPIQSPAPVSQAPVQPITTNTIDSSIYAPTHANVAPEFEGSGKIKYPNVTTKKSGKKAVLFAVIILLVLVIGGGGAYAYMFYIHPTPERVLAKMISNISSVTGFDYSVESVTTLTLPTPKFGVTNSDTATTPEAPTPQTVTVKGTGTVDAHDTNNIESESKFNLKTTLLPIDVEVQTKSINGVFYVQIPNIGIFTSFISPSLKAGDWLSFSKSDLENAVKDNPQLITRFGVGSDAFAKKLTGEEKLELFKALGDTNTIISTVELPKETLSGITLHRYQWTLDKNGLVEFLKKALPIISGKMITTDDERQLSEFADSFDITDGEIWIGATDFLPHKIMFTMRKKGDVTEGVNYITNTISFDNFGKTLSLSAPDTAHSYYDIFKTAREKGQDAKIKSSLASARAMAEIYYSQKGSYSGLCSATGTNSIESLLKNVNDTISPDKASCVDSKSSYRVYSHLVTDAVKYFCVDNLGTAIELITKPIDGYICK